MKTIIAGSRDIEDRKLVHQAIGGCPWTITEVVCGCARGVDTIGKEWAVEHGTPIKEFPAEWDALGTSAGPVRNRKMAEYADALILVWDGYSKGSANMLATAKKLGLEVHSVIRA